MKKLALISGLLFVVVYLVVNTVTSDDDSFDFIYPPPSSAPAQSESDNQYEPTRQVGSAATTGENPDSYLIIASFNDHDQALNAADNFSARFDADFVVLPAASNGYYRISYGRYSSAEEARNALESVKRNGFPDAWVLSSK